MYGIVSDIVKGNMVSLRDNTPSLRKAEGTSTVIAPVCDAAVTHQCSDFRFPISDSTSTSTTNDLSIPNDQEHPRDFDYDRKHTNQSASIALHLS
eukprot:scaffold1734_cov64-Cyclotella_meneghiniana.AAC.8